MAVVFDPPDVVRRTLLADLTVPFPVLVDQARDAYRAWGLRRVRARELWLDPGVWRQYARLLAAGERITGRGGDVRQMGGDFVVDRAGRLAYARPQERDDRPTVGDLMRVLESAR